jgi:hypothetical protein|tara:strand:- start:1468 stop:1992 length:525 start_codon:yes stop_codon:yes gene_type:complete
MSQIKVDSIIPRGGLPSGASGGIIQIKQAIRTSVFSQSLGQGVESDILVPVTITPQSSSSKILFMVTAEMGLNTTHGRNFTMKRGSTSICIGDADGSRSRRTSGSSSTNSSSPSPIVMTFLDSPNTTSTLTYGFTIGHNENGTLTAYLNRTDGDSNSSHLGRYASCCTVMEVST